MRLVKNEKKYWDFIRELRNDQEVQKGFVEQVNISEKQQEAYMEKHNDDYYVCLLKGFPVGYIGDVVLDIRLAVVPELQGRGIGKFMLNEYMKLVPNAIGKVKLDNDASNALFISCGFDRVAKSNEFNYYKKPHDTKIN